jgi:hypothetical protein
MVFPVKRVPTKEGLKARRGTRREYLNELPIEGLSTLPRSVEAAEAKGNELLEVSQRHIRKGEVADFLRLLGKYPGLICHSWTRETLDTLARQGVLERGPGRPTGCYQIYPLVIVALVEQLLSKKEVPNREGAFRRLEDLGVTSYAAAKDLFYRALREERFRAILLTSPEVARMVTAEEVADRVRKAETLQPGGRITRTVEDSQLESITFEAK